MFDDAPPGNPGGDATPDAGRRKQAPEPREGPSGEEAQGSDDRPHVPRVELPKGGGALKSIDEKFQVNAANGTASMTVPVPLSRARSGFMPALSLSYDSGNGNGVFGLGWKLGQLDIRRRTDRRLPRYEGDDVFVLSGSEDLVPALVDAGGGNWAPDAFTTLAGERVVRYRPRLEGGFARIERITPAGGGADFWKATTGDNVVTIYGLTAGARIADPARPGRIFCWLPELSWDDKGNCFDYQYLAEDLIGVPDVLPERNRRGPNAIANKHLKRIRYGNTTPIHPDAEHPYQPAPPVDPGYVFEVVLDYGDHDPSTPASAVQGPWPCRLDPFSQSKAGFDQRTYRLCRRILLFHWFKELGDGLHPAPVLVRSLDLEYRYTGQPALPASELRNCVLDYPIAIRQLHYRSDGAGGYDRNGLPPVSLEVQELAWDRRIHEVSSGSLENDPVGLGSGYQWVDLWSEGVSGILTEQGAGWFYKRNQGDGNLAPAQPVLPKPNLVGLGSGALAVQELEADGRKFLVSLTPPLRGSFEIAEEGVWNPFRPFRGAPNVDPSDRNVRYLDLDGDGRPDLVVSEESAFRWYPSAGVDGYEGPERAFKPLDEERGPALVFADSTDSIFLAAMTGGGLTDIVRVRNGEVCYWPNLGYGRFGPKVTMDFAPLLDTADAFDPARVRLADVSGTGAADLIYLGQNRFRAWLNRSGNSWSEEAPIEPFPETVTGTQLAVVDFLGNGTACLVWSSPLPGHAPSPMRYVDLMGGRKPYLLTGYRTNTGKTVRWEFRSSTHWYLEDRQAGRPWATRLPFPVHCVAKVRSVDSVSRAYLTSELDYHHGYFDHAEREYRGFGLVEQRDTETFDRFVLSGASNVVDEPLHQAPVLTRTWYHTGAYLERDTLEARFRAEFFQNPLFAEHHLPAPALAPAITTPRERREAARASKGMVLRQEIYGLDGLSGMPYSAVEHACTVSMLQPPEGDTPGVFLATECESISFFYERDAADPRITHQLHTDFDAYGHILRSASVSYPRQLAVVGLPAKVAEEQARLHVSFSIFDYTNDLIAPATYRLRRQAESRTYELTSAVPAAAWFDRAEIAGQFDAAASIEFEDAPDGSLQKRPLKRSRTLFLKDDLSGPLPLGQLESLGLSCETQRLAFTKNLLAARYAGRVTPALLVEGGYLRSNDYKALGLFPATDPDDAWWLPSGRVSYPLDAAAAFYLPRQYLDPFGNATTVTYDPDYQLSAVQVEDAAGNRTRVEAFDFRLLMPLRVKDPNDNLTDASYDLLGFPVATALRGKGAEADDLAGLQPDLAPAQIAAFFADPVANGPALLAHASVRYVYDYSVLPVRSATVVRETHHQVALAAGVPSRLRYTFEYADGFGKLALRKTQARPGIALQLDASNTVIQVDTTPALRWVGNGRIVRNNKGNAVKQYEPYFSATHAFEDDPQLVEIGVTRISTYDAPGRLIRTDFPDGTFATSVIGAWISRDFDPNDNVLASSWYAERTTGGLAGDAAEHGAALKAAVHDGTAAIAHADSLGRSFYRVAHNRFEDHATHLLRDERYETYTELDLEANQLGFIDARGNRMVFSEVDRSGARCHTRTADAGDRWTLNDCLGKPLYSWDSKQQVFHDRYDVMRRPTEFRVKKGAAAEFVFASVTYGEGKPNDKLLNLRGKTFEQRDQAALGTNVRYDFKGNLLRATMALVDDYRQDVKWNLAPVLQAEVFTTETSYDALSRPTRVVAPHSDPLTAGVSVPGYDPSGKLQTMDVYVRGAAVPVRCVQDTDYDARGQRQRLDLGNGTSTLYRYDPLTFRLRALITARGADPALFWTDPSLVGSPLYDACVLQDLSYAHDPVGNVTSVRDDAQQTIFFDNAAVRSDAGYTYDAIYRLSTATGREHIGQNRAPDPWDTFRIGNPLPSDGTQLRQYTQQYDYDACGNLLLMRNPGRWSRSFTYAAGNNQLQTAEPGGAPGPAFVYPYDEHGNVTQMPHLQSMEWDFQDQLRHVVLDAGAVPDQEAFYVYAQGSDRRRKVVRKGAIVEERVYFGNFERFRRLRGGVLELERETLHVVDDRRRIAAIETPTVLPNGSREQQLFRYQYGNHLGSACLEADGAARIISYEEYYPFGSTSYQGTDQLREVPAKRYRFTGQERDEESGLYYQGARYYAPWLARWTAVDPAGPKAGLNFYAYASNNPVMLSDPTGNEDVCGVYDENALVCRPEPCAPASLTPAVPTAAPQSSTAPRMRIRVEPRHPPPPPPPPSPPPSQGTVISPPPPVSGTDYTLYVPQGFAYQQYSAAVREADNPDNPMWARVTMGTLAVLAEPLALAEEYISRPILNVPFTMQNSGTHLGEHGARAYLWAQQGEYGEMTVDLLEATRSGTEGFNSGLSVGIPLAGALESRAVSTTTTLVTDATATADSSASSQAATTWQQHEVNVTQNLRAASPTAAVGEQVTLDVTNNTTGQAVRIRIDNTVATGPNTFQLVDAKFSSVRDLTTANLDSTVTANQTTAYGWIRNGENLTVTPAGPRAIAAGMTPGAPISIAPTVQVYVNTPTGIAIRTY